jgi:hypothetical protein
MNIGTHGVETTASEMRKRLAQALSKIPGDQKVFFNLTVHLENYSPAPKYSTYIFGANDFTTAVQGELARPENE